MQPSEVPNTYRQDSYPIAAERLDRLGAYAFINEATLDLYDNKELKHYLERVTTVSSSQTLATNESHFRREASEFRNAFYFSYGLLKDTVRNNHSERDLLSIAANMLQLEMNETAGSQPEINISDLTEISEYGFENSFIAEDIFLAYQSRVGAAFAYSENSRLAIGLFAHLHTTALEHSQDLEALEAELPEYHDSENQDAVSYDILDDMDSKLWEFTDKATEEVLSSQRHNEWKQFIYKDGALKSINAALIRSIYESDFISNREETTSEDFLQNVKYRGAAMTLGFVYGLEFGSREWRGGVIGREKPSVIKTRLSYDEVFSDQHVVITGHDLFQYYQEQSDHYLQLLTNEQYEDFQKSAQANNLEEISREIFLTGVGIGIMLFYEADQLDKLQSWADNDRKDR